MGHPATRLPRPNILISMRVVNYYLEKERGSISMKILRFRAEKMHGYLNLKISLRPDLTFLTGINGSGKTSAVRAITALLTPSISTLSNLSYQLISVTVEHQGTVIEIQSKRSNDEIAIYCDAVEGVLNVPVFKAEAYESSSQFLERQREFYREQEALNNKNPVLMAIDQLPTPMFLDLERRHQEGTRLRRDQIRHGARSPVNPLAGSQIESLKDAEMLGEFRYREWLRQRAQLTDLLKEEIILAAFRPRSDDSSDDPWLPDRPFIKKVLRDESVIPRSLSEIGISDEQIEHTVRPFFARVREVSRLLPTEKEFERIVASKSKTDEEARQSLFGVMREWSALQPQVAQIHYLAERVARYNTQLVGAFAPVQRYLTSVNGFLADSAKRLSFDGAGNLRVLVQEDHKARPITALSSGERQLVVILTHLAFNNQAKQANVLIIDEPELSLHLKWQELFVDAVINASPGLQLILATHSPSIIKGRLDNCIDVAEAQSK
jgi:energy-coupling factor transporter ATP-binding protein EcfA2